MRSGRAIAMVVICLVFVIASAFFVVVQPDAWPVAVTAALFFFGCGVVIALDGFGQRLRPATKARLMGAAGMVMGLGCGSLAWASWENPGAFYRAPAPWSIGIGLIGLVFFGGGGLLLMIRGGRPFGARRP